MKYISVFSGVEAASVAWEPLGWEPVAFSEIEPFPCAVLQKRFPEVPNLGDITNIEWSDYRGAVDLVVGGSPCQSFSVAGKREGLAGASGLMYEYIRCVRDVMPRYFLWENVPGALSVEGGAAFKQLLGEMDDLGYSLAWRVLDAQFFGVAQRRRRVFLVGSLGNERAGKILFEREGLRWDFKTGRDERARLAADAERGVGGSCGVFKWHQGSASGSVGFDFEVSPTCTADYHNPAVVYQKTARPRNNMECEKYAEAEVACTLNTFDLGEKRANELVVEPAYSFLDRCGNNWKNGKGGCGVLMQENVASTLATVFPQTILQPVVMATGQANAEITENGISPTLNCASENPIVCVADDNAHSAIDEGMSGALKVGGGKTFVAYREPTKYIVRRLTPMECERLQGFPDGWTDIEYKGKPAADSPRYKAMGNSMAVPVMRWIGERIQAVDESDGGKE